MLYKILTSDAYYGKIDSSSASSEVGGSTKFLTIEIYTS